MPENLTLFPAVFETMQPSLPAVLRIGEDVFTRAPRLLFGESTFGGRSWWAHLTFTRMDIGSIILENQIEDRLDRTGILESAPLASQFRRLTAWKRWGSHGVAGGVFDQADDVPCIRAKQGSRSTKLVATYGRRSE